MQRIDLTPYQRLIVFRWGHLSNLTPATPEERKLLERVRFSVWLEALRSGLLKEELNKIAQGAKKN